MVLIEWISKYVCKMYVIAFLAMNFNIYHISSMFHILMIYLSAKVNRH
jgi:hypothetical protein